jgi:RNA polymerase sigma-70 factor (ECF subfamily)
MPTTSDESLIAAIAQGDRPAMEALFARYRIPVFRFLMRMLRNEAVAEDLNSDVFLDVWRQAGTFEGRAAVSTWIFSIARYKALNALSRRPTEELDDETADAIEDQADDPEVALAKKDKAAVLRACLLKLSAEHREIVNLVYY